MKPETLAFLKQHGGEIGQKAAQGDLLCRRIVHLYQMYCGWQSDKAALALLEASVQEYRNHTASLPNHKAYPPMDKIVFMVPTRLGPLPYPRGDRSEHLFSRHDSRY